MKICTWGEVAGALRGETKGGGELQIALLAKAMARAGNEVTVIDVNIEEDFITEDGIKVFHIKGYNDGIKVFRFLTHRMPRLYSSLKAQNADVYYCQIRDFRHILAYWAARKTKGKFVLQLASDLDAKGLKMRIKHDYLTHFDGLFWFFKVLMIELIFPHLVRNADLVLVQHEGQKQDLLKRGIKSVIFSNLIEMNNIPEENDTVQKDFCYVGALDSRKGFAEFYELVLKAPFASFKVIGQPRDRTGYLYFDKLKTFNNVTLFGGQSHSQTLAHILNSRALISTSPMEGFPNIFIEAWACGIPVLSLSFDPGGVIVQEQLGEVANGNLDTLVEQMNKIQNTPEFARKAKEYVQKNNVLNDDKIRFTNTLFSDLIKN